jgi:hypothetical protein
VRRTIFFQKFASFEWDIGQSTSTVFLERKSDFKRPWTPEADSLNKSSLILYFCTEPENQNIYLPRDNRRAIRAYRADSIARLWSLADQNMSVGRKRLDARDLEHRRLCFQWMTIAALRVWEGHFLINHWRPSVKISMAKQYPLSVMCTEDIEVNLCWEILCSK